MAKANPAAHKNKGQHGGKRTPHCRRRSEYGRARRSVSLRPHVVFCIPLPPALGREFSGQFVLGCADFVEQFVECFRCQPLPSGQWAKHIDQKQANAKNLRQRCDCQSVLSAIRARITSRIHSLRATPCDCAILVKLARLFLSELEAARRDTKDGLVALSLRYSVIRVRACGYLHCQVYLGIPALSLSQEICTGLPWCTCMTLLGMECPNSSGA